MSTADSSTQADSPSVQEMVRILDVASALRREREDAERELDLAATKANLRQRLLASAELTGDRITADEVDFAIELYFADRHSLGDPPGGFQRTLAELYVRRGPWVKVAFVVVGLVALVWTLSVLAHWFGDRP